MRWHPASLLFRTICRGDCQAMCSHGPPNRPLKHVLEWSSGNTGAPPGRRPARLVPALRIEAAVWSGPPVRRVPPPLPRLPGPDR